MRISSNFFENKDTITLAKDLLGKVIVKKTEYGLVKGIINETEAYIEEDEASHSFGGKKTKKNEVMFEEYGHIYVYFTYGMHYCMNIVSESKGYGSAVLIRSVIPIEGEDIMIKNRKWENKNIKSLCNGPAKLCLALGINKNNNGVKIFENNSDIYLEDISFNIGKILSSKRVGITKAKEKKWRFLFN